MIYVDSADKAARFIMTCNQERMPPALMNDVLAGVFKLERRFVARGHLPFGLSYALLLRRPTAAGDGAPSVPGSGTA